MTIHLSIESVNIDTGHILEAVEGEALWTYGAEEWHRLYGEYVPMKSGALYNTVNITGGGLRGEIEHTVPYAHYCKEGLGRGPNVPILQGGAAACRGTPAQPKTPN